MSVLGLMGIEEVAKPAADADLAKAKAKSKAVPPKARPSAPKSAKSA